MSRGQTTNTLLMVRPIKFGFNLETAVDNVFQVKPEDSESSFEVELAVQEKALSEFNNLLSLLEINHINVIVIDDTSGPHTPDSIFPNNWISFHLSSVSDGDNVFGTICLYPMFAKNRRLERKLFPEVQRKLNLNGFYFSHIIDLTTYETKNQFLEGTGSLILDRENQIVYACLSNRTTESVMAKFCEAHSIKKVIIFEARDDQGTPIYHTNVLMTLGQNYAVICLDAIPNQDERNCLINSVEKSGKVIVPITMFQMKNFAGNLLQVENIHGEKFLIMSSRAYNSFTKEQIKTLESFNKILHTSLTSIEDNGGGSARCMLAEIFLPRNKKSIF